MHSTQILAHILLNNSIIVYNNQYINTSHVCIYKLLTFTVINSFLWYAIAKLLDKILEISDSQLLHSVLCIHEPVATDLCT